MVGLRLACSAEHQDVIMALLDELSPVGSSTEDYGLMVYFEEAPKMTKVKELCGDHVTGIELDQIEEVNWNEVWESNFQPVEIQDFCRIRADFHDELSSQFQHEITINPRMSFGTGHHETTSMMIVEMKDFDFESKEVLDFGTGTGILGILASKLGAKWIWANDIESNAVENARENALSNDVHNMSTEEGGIELFENKKFDVILANINRQVLLNTSEDLKKLLKPKAKLLISGILNKDLNLVDEEYKSNGFEKIKVSRMGEWTAVLYE